MEASCGPFLRLAVTSPVRAPGARLRDSLTPVSRSIHDTHSALRRLLSEDYADPRLKRALAREVRENLRRRRSIKSRLQEQRGRDGRPPVPRVDPASTPILVTDEGRFVHHAATEADIREVMRRMPSGSLDGLGPIRLRLGKEPRQSEDDEPDPYTGRHGYEALPGVYSHIYRGLYSLSEHQIDIHAYVHAAGAAGPLAIYLKLLSLAALVHELSHHFDRTFRTLGDRWRMDDEARDEGYANTEERAHVRTIVVPYLLERYPDECAAFRRWEALHARHELPLEAYADDADGALEDLAEALAQGKDPLAARVVFADGLLRAGRDADAATVIEGVLAERPSDPDAHVLRAVIADQRGQYDVVEASCTVALSDGSPYARAEMLLTHVYCEQARWDELAALATRMLARPLGARVDLRMLELRARACIERGQGEAAAGDIASLRQRATDADAVGRADALTALRSLRDGDCEAALAAAQRLLQVRLLVGSTRAEALAIRLESAVRLGRPAAEYVPDDDAIARLRGDGRRSWIDRLLASASE